MNKLVVIAILLFVTSKTVNAQSGSIVQEPKTKVCVTYPTATAVEKEVNDENLEAHPYGGTFQFISKKGKAKEIFTTDILKFVEDNRAENEEKIIALTANTKVRILSRKQLSDKQFKPFEFLYSFE